MHTKRRAAVSLALASLSGLGACASTAREAPIPHRKVGKPYIVAGRWYAPSENASYDEIGIASWYGPSFHGRPTANGEIFNMNQLTAAHPTLPLPSLVEVTNLTNGRALTVRLNDRGPFAKDRIIDLSRAAAERLGFREKGTAEVRVRYLGPASLAGGLVLEPRPVPTPSLAPQSASLAPAGADAGAVRLTQVALRAEPIAIEPVVEPDPATPAPTTTPVGTELTPYLIQLAAYSSEDAAKRVLLSSSTIAPGFIEPVQTSDGSTLFRVRLGPLDGEAAVDAAMERAAAAGFADARLIRVGD